MPAPILIEAVESEGFGGGCMVGPAFGDVEVADVFEGGDDGSPMVARLAGPQPVRLVVVPSPELTSWCASMDQCSRTSRARSRAVASAPGQAGDCVEDLAGSLAGGGVLPPAGDLDGLAGVRNIPNESWCPCPAHYYPHPPVAFLGPGCVPVLLAQRA
jgi:hypothetical protein